MKIKVKYSPLDYVEVALCSVRYKGRINEIKVNRGGVSYEVQYINDVGEIKFGSFYEDELKEHVEKPPTCFTIEWSNER